MKSYQNPLIALFVLALSACAQPEPGNDADVIVIGAGIAGLAAANETLVSSTVKDLVVGAGFDFEDRGEHELKGIENQWRCYSLTGIAPNP